MADKSVLLPFPDKRLNTVENRAKRMMRKGKQAV